jgi:hypothetical protein
LEKIIYLKLMTNPAPQAAPQAAPEPTPEPVIAVGDKVIVAVGRPTRQTGYVAKIEGDQVWINNKTSGLHGPIGPVNINQLKLLK